MENIEKIMEKLPEGYEQAAKETGAFKQAREVKSGRDLMHLILLYIVHGMSYIEVSVVAKLKGIAQISDVAFMGRFSGSGKLMKWLLEKLQPEATAQYKKPEKFTGYAIKADDASVVSTGGKVRTRYRLHYTIDIFEMKSVQYKLTPYETGESLTNFEIKPGDLHITDRMYGTKKSMEHCLSGGGDFISRIKKGAFDIYDVFGKEKLNLVGELRKLAEDGILDMECRFKNSKGKYVPIRICAMKKPKNTHENPKTDTKFMNNFIVVVTSLLDFDKFSGKDILDVYRLRWQVELYFKRLKSLLGFGDIPTKTTQNVETWLNAKLVAAILIEIAVSQVDFSPSWR
jgi:hypothetical protein